MTDYEKQKEKNFKEFIKAGNKTLTETQETTEGSMTEVNCCYNCANCFKVAYGTVLCCAEHKCQVEPCNHCEQWKSKTEAWNRRS